MSEAESQDGVDKRSEQRCPLEPRVFNKTTWAEVASRKKRSWYTDISELASCDMFIQTLVDGQRTFKDKDGDAPSYSNIIIRNKLFMTKFKYFQHVHCLAEYPLWFPKTINDWSYYCVRHYCTLHVDCCWISQMLHYYSEGFCVPSSLKRRLFLFPIHEKWLR